MQIPCLRSSHETLDRAFRIAVGDLATNVLPIHSGILDAERPALMAGLDYNFPWTRDAAINTWNGAGLIDPDLTRNTLCSVLEEVEGKIRIGDQYWDAIIWATGAWQQYLFTGDREFLALALEAVGNSLAFFEETEFDPDRVLFRGPASTSDGVAGYPDVYAETEGHSCILDWPRFHPDKVHPRGVGIPMHALSTNCLYYNGYRMAEAMAAELGAGGDPAWAGKAEALRASILDKFWMPEAGRFRYLVDPLGDSDRFECLGLAYAILFGVAGPEQADAALEATPVQPAGVPCVWPSFERYVDAEGYHVGRHSGCVWPPFQAFWAEAAARRGRHDLMRHELERIAEYAVRDNHFAEMYHPATGEIYGGLQELDDEPLRLWKSTDRQTWSATGLMRLVFRCLAGMEFEPGGIRFRPWLGEGMGPLRLEGLRYRRARLTLRLEGQGSRVAKFCVNGRESEEAFLPAEAEGDQEIALHMQP